MTAIADDTHATTAARFEALASPARWHLMQIIAEGKGQFCVHELTERMAPLSQPTVSFHLKTLHDAGLLTRTERWAGRGRLVYYALSTETLCLVRTELSRLLWKLAGLSEGRDA